MQYSAAGCTHGLPLRAGLSSLLCLAVYTLFTHGNVHICGVRMYVHAHYGVPGCTWVYLLNR